MIAEPVAASLSVASVVSSAVLSAVVLFARWLQRVGLWARLGWLN